jgi:hypothetical protein
VPSGNPFAPLIDVGAQVGPVSGGGQVSVGGVQVGDHHAAAGFVLLGLVILVILYKRNFRFSTTIG